MLTIEQIKNNITNNKAKSTFSYLYGESGIQKQSERYIHTLDGFCKYFELDENNCVNIYSAPGRTEIGGNHTDHQHGCVLAGSADMDSIAIVSSRNDNKIVIKSVGYDEDEIDINDLDMKQKEQGKAISIIRGILSRFVQLGYKIGSFNAYTSSNVIKASGLSSSAAFEVLVGTILNYEFNDGKITPVEIAQIGQYAENEYMGKPCGLLDQMSCSVGGFVFIDFNDPTKPIIKKVDYDFVHSGYTICIVDTGGNHADLTPEYGKIPEEMKNVAQYFGKEVLRQVDEKEFYNNIAVLRQKCGDRAILRAIHFFDENNRAEEEANALENNDFQKFLDLVQESGDSSYKYLQNVFATKSVEEQGISLALAISQKILGSKGAYRVHGGGFAGVIQAFVPNDMVRQYNDKMTKVFGEQSCTKLSIRPVGGYKAEF